MQNIYKYRAQVYVTALEQQISELACFTIMLFEQPRKEAFLLLASTQPTIPYTDHSVASLRELLFLY